MSLHPFNTFSAAYAGQVKASASAFCGNHSDWIDFVPKNSIIQLSAAFLPAENVARAAKHEKLRKQISAPENKLQRERQLNRQMEMNAELKRLRKELATI